MSETSVRAARWPGGVCPQQSEWSADSLSGSRRQYLSPGCASWCPAHRHLSHRHPSLQMRARAQGVAVSSSRSQGSLAETRDGPVPLSQATHCLVTMSPGAHAGRGGRRAPRRAQTSLGGVGTSPPGGGGQIQGPHTVPGYYTRASSEGCGAPGVWRSRVSWASGSTDRKVGAQRPVTPQLLQGFSGQVCRSVEGAHSAPTGLWAAPRGAQWGPGRRGPRGQRGAAVLVPCHPSAVGCRRCFRLICTHNTPLSGNWKRTLRPVSRSGLSDKRCFFFFFFSFLLHPMNDVNGFGFGGFCQTLE